MLKIMSRKKYNKMLDIMTDAELTIEKAKRDEQSYLNQIFELEQKESKQTKKIEDLERNNKALGDNHAKIDMDLYEYKNENKKLKALLTRHGIKYKKEK